MLEIKRKVKELAGCTPDSIPSFVLNSNEPVILKGLVNEWAILKKSKTSDLVDYINHFYKGMTIGSFRGIGIKGRYFYDKDIKALNFTKEHVQLDEVLAFFVELESKQHNISRYVGSVNIDKLLPGFRKENDLNILSEKKPLASIWFSNESRISAHQDAPDNIACCVTGKRTFTLFPPEQIENLYVGPLDNTPAGQAISLVDFHAPDYETFPKFKNAINAACVANLEPGDALFIPSLWWHHVEALSDFNILVNYWWNTSDAFMGAPMDVLNHAFLNIKGLPQDKKKAWKALFDYYIFNGDSESFSHIPDSSRGMLEKLDDDGARRLRSMLINKLNR